MVVEPLDEKDLPGTESGAPAVTGERAIDIAMKYWGLSESDIDPEIGAVRARWRPSGKPASQTRKVWIVTSHAKIMSQGPATSRHFVTDRLCTVIDAGSGQFLMAYAAGTQRYVDERP